MNFVTSFKVFCLTALLCFLSTREAHAQNDAVNSQSECQKLIDKGAIAIQKNQFGKAVEYLTKAEYIAEKNKLTESRITIKNNLGYCYDKLSNFGESLGQYKKALDLVKDDPKRIDEKIIILCNIGIIYSYEKDFATGLSYLMEAYPVAKKLNSDLHRSLLAINISDFYNKLGDYRKARFYLVEVESLRKDDRIKNFLKLNYAETFVLEGRVKDAQPMLEDLIKDPKLQDDIYVYAVEFLSKMYSDQGKHQLAINTAKSGLKRSPIMNEKIHLYNQLAEFYFKNKDYVKSKQYKDSVITAKDSLTKLINRGLFESNKVKFKVQQYQNELQLNQEKQSAERKIFIGGIIASLLLSFFIYKALKSKILKQKQEKLLADNRQKIIDLELEGLKNNIAEKNRKLSAKALYLSSRNELIEEVIISLSQIPEVSASKQVSDYMRTLKGYLKTDAEWDDFISYFEQVNPEFIRKLTTRYPDLTPADIRFICYVYMNLDTKEIGNIFNITYNAAKKRKARIKEKMNIHNEASLYDHLLQIA